MTADGAPGDTPSIGRMPYGPHLNPSQEHKEAAMSAEVLKRSSVALLTTYSRDGSGVGTPVNVRIDDARLYFTTRAKTWKVKRLARNPQVMLAPSTLTGKPTGPTVPGRAHRLDRVDKRRFQTRFWILVWRVIYRDRPVTYEVTIEDPSTSRHR